MEVGMKCLVKNQVPKIQIINVFASVEELSLEQDDFLPAAWLLEFSKVTA